MSEHWGIRGSGQVKKLMQKLWWLLYYLFIYLYINILFLIIKTHAVCLLCQLIQFYVKALAVGAWPCRAVCCTVHLHSHALDSFWTYGGGRSGFSRPVEGSHLWVMGMLICFLLCCQDSFLFSPHTCEKKAVLVVCGLK